MLPGAPRPARRGGGAEQRRGAPRGAAVSRHPYQSLLNHFLDYFLVNFATLIIVEKV